MFAGSHLLLPIISEPCYNVYLYKKKFLYTQTWMYGWMDSTVRH